MKKIPIIGYMTCTKEDAEVIAIMQIVNKLNLVEIRKLEDRVRERRLNLERQHKRIKSLQN